MMKYLMGLLVLSVSLSAQAGDIRLCPAKEPFPPHSEVPDLSKDDYEWEKHVHQLAYDELEDISYARYLQAFEYLENEFPRQLKLYGHLSNSSELSSNFHFYKSAIKAYTLRQRALVQYYSKGEGDSIKEFCEYLSTLEYHP